MYNRSRPPSTQKAPTSSKSYLTDYGQPASKQYVPIQMQNLKGGQDYKSTQQQLLQPPNLQRVQSTKKEEITYKNTPSQIGSSSQTQNYYQQQQMVQSSPIETAQSAKSTLDGFKYKQQSKGVCGLRNIGNTCFMNSVLQCMFNLKDFNEAFLNNSYQQQINPVKNNSVPKEYGQLIQQIRSTNNYDSVAPHGLKSAVQNIAPNFRGYAQQDAQEFLVALLDGISQGMNRVRSKPIYKELSDALDKRTLQDMSDEWWEYSKNRESSLVLDFFQGQLLNEIKCSVCGKQSFAFDTFQDISLSIARLQKLLMDIDLNRMIDTYLQEESVEDFYCSKCKKHQRVKRRFYIWRLPKVLVFHIKRFDYRRFSSSKLDNRIIFPYELDMSNFIYNTKDQTTKKTKYQLQGIVNHSGTLYGGHYTADGRNPYDGKWYRYNDSDVREINIQQMNYATIGSSSPYILFYTKLE